MKKLLKRIASLFSRNGNGAVPEIEADVAPEQITRRNVDQVTGKLKASLIKARAELECVEQKLGGESASVECAD